MLHHLAWAALWFSPISLVNSASINARSTAPVVDLGYAQYQGSFDSQTNITSFLGVRYAAPPTGNLRFQAPQAPATVSGVQPATQNPNMCYQTGYGANTTGGLISPFGHNKRQSTTPSQSEDCLFLNVFVPETTPARPVTDGGLPVLVWIHGGGYQFGYAAMYNGVDLVTDSLNTMIVVVIQYRLGVFGFLSSNEIKAQGALNTGLLDQNFALQWVQKYIGQFGGNSGHVTIWGESAGGGSVLQHIVAHGGNTHPPLFNGAIASSLYLPSQYLYNDRLPQSLYDQTAAISGCASSSNTFTCLQAADVNSLQSANSDLTSAAFFGTFIFTPVVDGTFIVDHPSVTLANGELNGKALLVMNNQNEGFIFVNQDQTISITDYISILFPDMTFDQVQQAAQVYQNYGTAVEQAVLVMQDSIFLCPAYALLDAFDNNSWKGLFAIPPAHHGDDVGYYFPSVVTPSYNNPVFITAFSQSFMSLAKFYNVNIKFDPANITPPWSQYQNGATEMLFNKTASGNPVVAPITTDQAQVKRCQFWSSVAATTQQ